MIHGAQPWVVNLLSARGWRVNQTSGENMHTWQAPAIVDANRRAFGLGRVVIIQLGTNDGISSAELASYVDTLMQHLATVERVYWVNMRQFTSWVPAANATLAAAAAAAVVVAVAATAAAPGVAVSLVVVVAGRRSSRQVDPSR